MSTAMSAIVAHDCGPARATRRNGLADLDLAARETRGYAVITRVRERSDGAAGR